uniref:C-type lectin domain-containing protein n=1 Tax=Oreochromis niloticus TaxID=8128 RepID=A0A669AX88_ORENI
HRKRRLFKTPFMRLGVDEDYRVRHTTSKVSCSPRGCPYGWTWFRNRCFRYVPRRMNWVAAEKNCQSMKANLASVHSAEENQNIQKVIKATSLNESRTWIGGTDCQMVIYPNKS